MCDHVLHFRSAFLIPFTQSILFMLNNHQLSAAVSNTACDMGAEYNYIPGGSSLRVVRPLVQGGSRGPPLEIKKNASCWHVVALF